VIGNFVALPESSIFFSAGSYPPETSNIFTPFRSLLTFILTTFFAMSNAERIDKFQIRFPVVKNYLRQYYFQVPVL